MNPFYSPGQTVPLRLWTGNFYVSLDHKEEFRKIRIKYFKCDDNFYTRSGRYITEPQKYLFCSSIINKN